MYRRLRHPGQGRVLQALPRGAHKEGRKGACEGKKKLEEGTAAPTFWEWLEWAEDAAYSLLELKPQEFYELSPLELLKLLDGYEKRRLGKLWIAAYFTANIMGVDVKNISPEKLMRPFLPIKSKEEKEKEREDFFTSFYEKRKEAEAWRP